LILLSIFIPYIRIFPEFTIIKMQFTISTIAAVAALLSSASALPAPSEDSVTTTGDVVYIPPQSQPSGNPLTKRGPTDVFGDFTGQWSSHTDGSGTYVRSEDTHRYSSGDKCWTDLFYVSNSFRQNDYTRAGSIDCPSTSECEAGVDTGIQTCSEFSISVSAGFEVSILKDVLGVSGSTEITNSESKCDSITTKSTCKWTPEIDGTGSRCHAIWTATTQKVNHGYIRRRCDFHDGKGDQTVWSKDLDIAEKANQLHLGCNADCAAGSYTP
jgi:hypothetical protein